MQKSEVNHLSQLVNNTVDEIIDLKIMVSNIKATNSNAFSESSQDHRDNTIVPRLKWKASELLLKLKIVLISLRIGFNNAFTSQEGLTKAADLRKLQIDVV